MKRLRREMRRRRTECMVAFGSGVDRLPFKDGFTIMKQGVERNGYNKDKIWNSAAVLFTK